jgi:hypothetical protein
MQEIKNKIRVAAAALAGGLMLGATMAGAFAANLSEMPAPFVVNNNMAGQIVVGASATVPDVIAAAQISAALGQYMVSASSGGVSDTTRVYKQEELALNGVVSSVLGTTITDTSVSKLLDKEISFKGENYDIHEAIILGGADPAIATGLDDDSGSLGISGVRNADDYGSAVGGKAYMRLTEAAISYRYYFDDTLNGTATETLIDTDHPLKVSLMGQEVQIVDIVDDDTITVQMGNQAVLADGGTMSFGEYTVTIDTITSTAVALTVTGAGCDSSKFITNTESDTFCAGDDVTVEVEKILYVDADSPGNKVQIRAGTETTDTVNHGDKFMSEDASTSDSDATWKWSIVSSAGVLDYIGAYFAQTATDLGDDTYVPVSVGGMVTLPYDYAMVKLVGYTSETRSEYQLTFDTSEDLYDDVSGSVTENDVKVAILAGAHEDAFVLSGTETQKIAFYQETDGVSTETVKIAVYDADESKWDIEYTLNNISTVGTGYNNTGIDLTFQDTTYNLGLQGAGDNYNITLWEGATVGASVDVIKIVLSDDTSGFQYLGWAEDDAELAELSVGTTAEYIGTSESDVLTHYGTLIKNPTSKGDGDKVVFEVPDDQVKVYVYVGPVGATSASSGDVSYAYTGLTSEVAKLDNEANTNVPLIIVGGPYANSLARTLVGSDDAAIQTFFGYDATANTGKGIVKLYDSSETTWGVDALLVAGWTASDTRAAAYTLGKYLTGAKSLSALSGKTEIAITATGATTITDEVVN